MEDHLQGSASPPDRGFLSSHLQAATGTSPTGLWLSKRDALMGLGRDQSVLEGDAIPGSPPSTRNNGSKKATILSPASPLDPSCWSPAPGSKPLKKIKHNAALDLAAAQGSAFRFAKKFRHPQRFGNFEKITKFRRKFSKFSSRFKVRRLKLFSKKLCNYKDSNTRPNRLLLAAYTN